MKQYPSEEVKVCDLCAGMELTPELVVNGCNLLKCSTCGLVFTSPRDSEESLLRMYENEYYEKASTYLSSQLQQPPEDMCRLAESVKKRLTDRGCGKTPRSLDVGCGGGAVVAAFRRSGWEAVGIDLSEAAINAGRNQGLDLYAMDVAQVEPHSFDVVTAFHVLEHVSSPRTFLNQCVACLAPRGILIFEVPNYESRNSRRLRELWPYLYPNLHLYQFTVSTLKKYLDSLNLDMISIRTVNGYGPAEDYSSVPGSDQRQQSRIKGMLQESRHFAYLIPGAKPFLRWLFWQALGYGEFIRVFCRRGY